MTNISEWTDSELFRAIEVTKKHLFIDLEEQKELIDEYKKELIRRLNLETNEDYKKELIRRLNLETND